jgi:hypothetical protein
MAEIITKDPINWGGFDPSILNHVKISIDEIFRNENLVTFEITDKVLEKKSQTIEDVVSYYYTDFCVTRKKQIVISAVEYGFLHDSANAYIEAHYPTATTYERDNMRSEVALLLSFTTNLLDNGKCGYNTNPEDWKLFNF